MGFLTTITFYNDAHWEIDENRLRIAEIVIDAQNGIQKRAGRNYDGIGGHSNAAIIQKPRHADDHTLYMHAGNTIVDVWEAESEWAVDQFIIEMEYHLKRLKEIRKARKSNEMYKM